MEERDADELRPAVAEVFQRGRLDDDVARHAVPLERAHAALRRRDLAIAPLEAVHAVVGMLHVAPVSAAHGLVALDDELVAASPPLRDEDGIGHGTPHTFARGV